MKATSTPASQNRIEIFNSTKIQLPFPTFKHLFVLFLFSILLLTSHYDLLMATGNSRITISVHTVQKGENLYRISKRYGTSVDYLQRLNALRSAHIQEGQHLRVPVRYVQRAYTSHAPRQRKIDTRQLNSRDYQQMLHIALKRRELTTRPSSGRIHQIRYRNGVLANVEDRVPSRHTVHHDGIRYYGRDRAYHAFIARYTRSLRDAKALEFASSNEGKFDALNFYDGSASVGFIQFNAKHGALGYLLALIKEQEPFVFQKLFQEYGIDVEYYRHTASVFSIISIVVIAPEMPGGKLKLYNDEAVAYLRKNKHLAGIFIRAFRNDRLQACQVKAAVQMFVKPIQDSWVKIGQRSYHAGRLLRSEAGTAAMVDLSVKLGTEGARRLLENAVRYAAVKSGKGYNGVSYLTEYEIVKSVMAVTHDATVKKRMQKLLDSRLSFYPRYS